LELWKVLRNPQPVLALFEKHSGDACPGLLPLSVQSAGALVIPRCFPVDLDWLLYCDYDSAALLLLPCCFCCPVAALTRYSTSCLPTVYHRRLQFVRLPSPLPNLDLPSSLSSSLLLLEIQPPRPRPRPDILERLRPLLSTSYHPAYSRGRLCHHPYGSQARTALYRIDSTAVPVLWSRVKLRLEPSPCSPVAHDAIELPPARNPLKSPWRDQFLYLRSVPLSLLGERH
jgi:hypothetical protein